MKITTYKRGVDMACIMPECSLCKYFQFPEVNCLAYPNGIPGDVLSKSREELKRCPNGYCFEKID